MPTTTNNGYPYPAATDAPDGPGALYALATAIDGDLQSGDAWTPIIGGADNSQSIGAGGVSGGTWGQVGRTVTLAGRVGFGSGSTLGTTPAILGGLPINLETATMTGHGWIRHAATGAIIPILLFPTDTYAMAIQIITNGGTSATTQTTLPIVQSDTFAFSIVGTRA